MSLNSTEIAHGVELARPLLFGAKLIDVRDIRPDRMLFIFGGQQENLPLVFDLRREQSRFHLWSSDLPKKPPRHGLTQWLRSRLIGDVLSEFHIEAGERVVFMDFPSMRLVFHLMGRHSDAVVCDSNGRMVISWRNKLRPGDIYQLPRPAPMRKNIINRFSAADFCSWSRQVVDWYKRRQHQAASRQLAERSTRAFTKKRKEINRSIERLRAEEAKLDDPEKWTHWGDLIKANLDSCKTGQGSMAVRDWQNDRTITIPLLPDKDGIENMNHYYRLARKARSGLPVIGDRLALKENEKQRLDEIEAAADQNQLAAFDLDDKTTRRQRPIRRQRQTHTPFHQFVSRGGYPILVGKSARDNDLLITRIAKPYHLWFHVHGMSGSHVILAIRKNSPVNVEDRQDAQQLAIAYSKARDEIVEVIEAKVNQLRKVSGAPGKVMVRNEKRQMVRRQKQELTRIQATRIRPDR